MAKPAVKDYMSRSEIESAKVRADALVKSYGALRLSSRFEEALGHLGKIWEIDAIDMEILRPSRSAAISNAVGKAASYINGTAKGSAVTLAGKHAKDIMKTAGSLSEKGKVAVARTMEMRTGVATATKAGAQIIRSNPLTTALAGLSVAGAGFGLGKTLKRELRNFSESCYQLKLSQLEESA